jgi:hypothetical protein
MARDLLCIPLSGVGVERVFNFARDICHYRRGQLQSDTIRALILVYHSQNREAYIDRLQDSLLKTIDIKDMTEEEIDDEVATRESEMSGWYQNLEDWDRDHYISDVDSDTEHNIPPHTERFRPRDSTTTRRRHNRQLPETNQALSLTDASRRDYNRRILDEHAEHDRQNPGIYDFPYSDLSPLQPRRNTQQQITIPSSPPLEEETESGEDSPQSDLPSSPLFVPPARVPKPQLPPNPPRQEVEPDEPTLPPLPRPRRPRSPEPEPPRSHSKRRLNPLPSYSAFASMPQKPISKLQLKPKQPLSNSAQTKKISHTYRKREVSQTPAPRIPSVAPAQFYSATQPQPSNNNLSDDYILDTPPRNVTASTLINDLLG